MKIFKPTPGKGVAWGIGGMIVSILPLAIIMGINLAGKPNYSFLLTMGIILVLMTAMFGYFTWAAKNMQYVLTEKELIIIWAFNRKVIPLDSIRGIRRISGTGAMKVVGASMPGIHIGSFTDPTGKGTVNMFASRLWGEIILLKSKWEIIGFTPENPEQFLEALEEAAARPLAEWEMSADDGAAGADYEMWRDRRHLFMFGLNLALIAGAFFWVYYMSQSMPDRVPMHYNLAGEITRYGSPKEHYLLPGIGLGTFIFMSVITATVSKNNKTSVYLMDASALFLNLLFLGILVSIRFSL